MQAIIKKFDVEPLVRLYADSQRSRDLKEQCTYYPAARLIKKHLDIGSIRALTLGGGRPLRDIRIIQEQTNLHVDRIVTCETGYGPAKSTYKYLKDKLIPELQKGGVPIQLIRANIFTYHGLVDEKFNYFNIDTTLGLKSMKNMANVLGLYQVLERRGMKKVCIGFNFIKSLSHGRRLAEVNLDNKEFRRRFNTLTDGVISLANYKIIDSVDTEYVTTNTRALKTVMSGGIFMIKRK